jgi:hypothetical protein
MGQLDAATGASVEVCIASLWPGVARVAPTDDVLTRAERLLARYPLPGRLTPFPSGGDPLPPPASAP